MTNPAGNGNGPIGETTYDAILGGTYIETPLASLTRSDVFFEGGSHIFAAQAKAGKTTLMHTLVHDWALDGHKVLYFSEEHARVWAFRGKYLDLQELGDAKSNLTIITPDGRGPGELLSRALNGPEDIIVVDSITNILQVTNMGNARAVRDAILPWTELLGRKGKTLIFLHHMTKGSKDNATMAGSYQLSATVDTLIQMTIKADLRAVKVQSRFLSDEAHFAIVKVGNILSVQELPGELTLTASEIDVYENMDTLIHATVGELAKRTRFTEAKVRRILRKLEAKGLAKNDATPPDPKGPGQWVMIEDE